jgi:hypothetical protein
MFCPGALYALPPNLGSADSGAEKFMADLTAASSWAPAWGDGENGRVSLWVPERFQHGALIERSWRSLDLGL